MVQKFTLNKNKDLLNENMEDLKGLVLAGGQSSRMGKDKSNLVYYQDAHKYHMLDMLRSIGLDSFISLRQEQEQKSRYKFITDTFENIGPMGGVASAFSFQKSAWLVVACDYPHMKTQILEDLIAMRNKSKIATVYYDENADFIIPTCAIYEMECFDLILEAIQKKEYSLQKLLKQNKTFIINSKDESFKSVDRVEEFISAKAKIHERRTNS